MRGAGEGVGGSVFLRKNLGTRLRNQKKGVLAKGVFA